MRLHSAAFVHGQSGNDVRGSDDAKGTLVTTARPIGAG